MRSQGFKSPERNSVRSPKPKTANRKKLVTRQTVKVMHSQTETLGDNQKIKTSNENIVTTITEQFKSRANLFKKTSTTNITNEVSQRFIEGEENPLHKKVRILEETQVKKQANNGKVRIQRKSKENAYEEVMSDDDGDEQLEDWNLSQLKISDNIESKYKESEIKNQGQPESYMKGQSTFYEKESALMPKESTISADYESLIKKYMQERNPSNNNSTPETYSGSQQQKMINYIINSPQFKRKNIIKAPYFSSQAESEESDLK